MADPAVQGTAGNNGGVVYKFYATLALILSEKDFYLSVILIGYS